MEKGTKVGKRPLRVLTADINSSKRKKLKERGPEESGGLFKKSKTDVSLGRIKQVKQKGQGFILCRAFDEALPDQKKNLGGPGDPKDWA